jgi:hypothetical protein
MVSSASNVWRTKFQIFWDLSRGGMIKFLDEAPSSACRHLLPAGDAGRRWLIANLSRLAVLSPCLPWGPKAGETRGSPLSDADRQMRGASAKRRRFARANRRAAGQQTQTRIATDSRLTIAALAALLPLRGCSSPQGGRCKNVDFVDNFQNFESQERKQLAANSGARLTP